MTAMVILGIIVLWILLSAAIVILTCMVSSRFSDHQVELQDDYPSERLLREEYRKGKTLPSI